MTNLRRHVSTAARHGWSSCWRCSSGPSTGSTQSGQGRVGTDTMVLPGPLGHGFSTARYTFWRAANATSIFAMLNEAEVETYHREGFVIPQRFRLAENELTKLHAALDAVLVDNPDILPDRLINPHLNGGKPYGIKGQREFRNLALDPRILDMAEQVMGPDLILLFTHLFCKPATSKRVVPWHQDGPFWPVEPMASCTVWVALDDVDEGNGAMKVIPRSHKDKALEHRLVDDENSTLNRELPIDNVDHTKAELIELRAGQVSLQDIGLVHASAANTSGRRRAGLALRYMPATSCMYRVMPNAAANWEDMPMELVRGVNRNPGNDFSKGKFGTAWI